MNIPRETSATLMIANLFFTVLVIAIHYNTLTLIDVQHYYNVNYLFQQFIANGIARSAVPFFALISGFFLLKKLGEIGYKATIKNKYYTLFIPYITTCVLCFSGVACIKYIKNQENVISTSGIYAMIYNIIMHPITFQLWFIRDMIFLALFSVFIFSHYNFIFNTVGVLSFFLWILNIQPLPIVGEWYLINTEVLFFFWLGGLLYKRNVFDVKFLHKKSSKFIFVLIWFLLVAIRIMVYPQLDIWYKNDYTILSLLLYKVAIGVGVVSVVQFSYLFINNRMAIYFSGLTFFVYLFHLAPLSMAVGAFTKHFIDAQYGFYVNFPIATVSSFVIAHLLLKIFPSVYLFITGGRTPNKSIKRI